MYSLKQLKNIGMQEFLNYSDSSHGKHHEIFIEKLPRAIRYLRLYTLLCILIHGNFMKDVSDITGAYEMIK